MSHVGSVRSARILLLLAGTLWGAWYSGMYLVGWGEPGSAGYRRYEIFNRFTVAILGLLAVATWMAHRYLCRLYARAGRISVYTIVLGLLVMALGNVLEFWVFTLTPYESGSLRGIGWGAYCAGLLLFYLGSAGLGVVLLRHRELRLTGALMLAWLPTGVLFLALGSLVGTQGVGFSVAVAICGASYVLLGLRLGDTSDLSPRARIKPGIPDRSGKYTAYGRFDYEATTV